MCCMKQLVFLLILVVFLVAITDIHANPRYKQTKCPEPKRQLIRLNLNSLFTPKEEDYIPKKAKKENQPEVVKVVDRSNFYVKNYKEPKQRFHEKGWRKWQCR